MKHKNFLKARAKKFGLPPGTLTFFEKECKNSKCLLVEYTDDKKLTKENPSIGECIDSIKNKKNKTWLTFYGPLEEKAMLLLGETLKLHQLLMEDIVNSMGRAKVEDYGNFIFLALHHLEAPKTTATFLEVEQTQISILLGESFVIVFAERNTAVFSPILNRFNQTKSRLQSAGIDYLCYTLLDCICDHYFVCYEQIESELSEMESSVLANPDASKIPTLQEAKKIVYALKKSIWPMRDAISKLLRLDSSLIQKETKTYLQDVFDHLLEASEVTEHFIESVKNLFEIYLALVNQKMNEIVKVLTIVSTTFTPIAFIASIYGMNFVHMPEHSWEWGYYFALALMFCVASFMIVFFKRRKWI